VRASDEPSPDTSISKTDSTHDMLSRARETYAETLDDVWKRTYDMVACGQGSPSLNKSLQARRKILFSPLLHYGQPKNENSAMVLTIGTSIHSSGGVNGTKFHQTHDGDLKQSNAGRYAKKLTVEEFQIMKLFLISAWTRWGGPYLIPLLVA
jgi:hypothetical protein